MLQTPVINKKNWKKVLRELDKGEFPSMPEKLKVLGAKLREKKAIPYVEEVIGFSSLKKYFEEFNHEINAFYLRNIDYSQFNKKPPLAHQIEGVEFLLKNDRCILGDTMGKGKTLTSIYAALSMDTEAKILIVSTNSLKYNFASEVKVFTDQYSVIEKKWVDNKIVIIHYEALKKYIEEIAAFKPDVIICDEAHEVKNLKTGKAKGLSDILKKYYPKKLWLLTGTPVANRPIEFFSLLKLLKHPLSKNWQDYVVRYCNAEKNYYGNWETKGASNLKELHQLTKPILLRRVNKKGDLPNYKRYPYYLTLNEEQLVRYEKSVTDYEKRKQDELLEEFGGLGLAKYATQFKSNDVSKISFYRQFCAKEKINDDSLINLVQKKLSDDPTNKIIIFSNFIEVLDKIKEKFGDICIVLDGKTKDPLDRQKLVENFNNTPELKILACNLKIGGTGYNIQSANIVICNDMDWVPNTMLQAECRIWRFGQTRDVEFIYPIYENSVESSLYDVVNGKMKIISELIDGTREDYFEGEIDIEDDFENIKAEDILKEIFMQLSTVEK